MGACLLERCRSAFETDDTGDVGHLYDPSRKTTYDQSLVSTITVVTIRSSTPSPNVEIEKAFAQQTCVCFYQYCDLLQRPKQVLMFEKRSSGGHAIL